MPLHQIKERMAEHDGSSNLTHHAHTLKQPTKTGHVE